MSAKDCIIRLANTNIPELDLRYCLVDEKKNPYKINGNRVLVNQYNDFTDIMTIARSNCLDNWAGLGFSIQASNIIGIDLDHCVNEPLNINTISENARDIIDMFKDFSYIEFSFSGKGIRILLKDDLIVDYESRFYIKNSNLGIEFYQPKYDNRVSNRYLTITGNYIYDNISTKTTHKDTILSFLNKYMRKTNIEPKNEMKAIKEDNRNIDELYKILKKGFIKDYTFGEDYLLNTKHPLIPTQSDESERDFRIIDYIYCNVTQDREKVKQLFEMSPFFKTKDNKHMIKWNKSNFRYFNWQFDHIIMKYKGK